MNYRFLCKSAIIIFTILVPIVSLSSTTPLAIAQSPSAKSKSKPRSTRFTAPVLGKYGCSVSEYNSVTQTYEYKAKGSFTLLAGNAYRYNGFSKPSAGRYSFDAGSGKIRFHGGYLDKGEATPISGYKNRYTLVSPTLSDHRWTCTLLQ